MRFYLFGDDERAADIRLWAKELNGQSGIKFVDRVSQAEVIAVAGGDGTMLRAIKKFYRSQLPFFGINRGTVGFLLNQVSSSEEFKRLLLRFESHQQIDLFLLRARFSLTNGKFKDLLAFNDVYLNAKAGTSVWGNIKGSPFPLQEFKGDGIIVSTPQGSTAYNSSAGGSVLSLRENLFAIATICCSGRRIRAAVTRQRLEINLVKGEAVAHADNTCVRHFKSIAVEPTSLSVRLVFTDDSDFESKRYLV